VWRAGLHGWLSLDEASEELLPPWPPAAGEQRQDGHAVTLVPLEGVRGLWLGVIVPGGRADPATTAAIATLVSRLARTEHQADQLSDELTRRYEEIDLLYGLSEVFGRTVGLEEAAAFIVREVSEVVGARRASIMVHDEAAGLLRTVAAQGFPARERHVVEVADPRSVAARVFRERRAVADLTEDGQPTGERGYRGESFLSIPICTTPPGGTPKCLGVINLTDRAGGQAFTPASRRLVEAVATQIGAAIENARLVLRDREQQRLRRDLELAHDLQRKLLPSPAVLGKDAQVAVHFAPADSVGGDFYTFSRLGLGCVSVMVGDVSSHGIAAALIMAIVIAAAAIHAPASITPDQTLEAMRDSLAQKLDTTESYLTVFHGILDPINRRLTYASAGHPQAFRIPVSGPPQRLDTTSPPLGLDHDHPIDSRQVAWSPGQDLLCAWTDGLVDATGAAGERYGESRLLAQLAGARAAHPDEIVRRVLADLAAFTTSSDDDQTLLVLRI
jgi:sigma-B regulation protein RsbU (phosphoserine phosphatase)